jgi:hypothetical protein
LSQTISIKDSAGSEIPYATIEILKKKGAYFSDATGKIDLNSLPVKDTDTLVISSIGFKTVRIAKNTIGESVVLQAYIRKLPEAFASIDDWKRKYVIRKKKKSRVVTAPVQLLKGPGEQVARIIFPDKKLKGPVLLETVSFQFMKAANTKAPVRLRIYEVDDRQMPGADILTRSLVTKMDSGEGWLDFDLSEDAIRMSEKGIIVAIEFFDTDSMYWYKDANWIKVDSGGNPERVTENILGGYFRLDDYMDDCRTYKRIGGEWIRIENRMLLRPNQCYNLVTAVTVKYPDKRK